MILNFNKRIINAEKHGKWHEAIQIAYRNWKSDPLDSNVLLCVISEIWYVLTFYIDRLVPLESVSREDLQEKLDETSKFAIENFAESAEVNVLLGYYIDVMPYMFLSVDSVCLPLSEKISVGYGIFFDSFVFDFEYIDLLFFQDVLCERVLIVLMDDLDFFQAVDL